MEDLDDGVSNVVGGKEDALVGNTTVQGEAHGLVVRVLPTTDTALGVAVVFRFIMMAIVVSVSGSLGNGDNKSEFHASLLSLWQKHPVGDTASPVEFFEVQF